MFVGHVAVALSAKSRAPEVSLGWWLAAAIMLDLLWPVFLLFDLEQARAAPGASAFTPFIFDSYPWSHSLLMACVWGIVVMMIARWRGVSWRTGILLALVVISHWVLDWISHTPDMPLWPPAWFGDAPRYGLGLWNSIAATYVIEGLLYLGGMWLYVRATHARDGAGSIGFWALIIFCAVMWAAGPWTPPPSPAALAWSGHAAWLLVLWAWWVDRHREIYQGQV